MPKGRPAATTADDIADNIRSLIDRVVDAKFTHEMTRRGQDIASAIADRSAEVGERAGEAWRDSGAARRDAAKRLSRASNDAAKWSDDTWRRSLRPALRDLWRRRTLAIGAAGAAIPASRELADSAAMRLGLKQREERHWGAFFLGLLLGAAAGAVIALLTTPKRGNEMRHELAARARDTEWVPIFQRESNGHGQEAGASLTAAGENLADAAAEGGAAAGDAAEQAAADTAEAINEAYDSVDRESAS